MGRISTTKKMLFSLIVAVITLSACELLLRCFCKNPFVNESPAFVVRIRLPPQKEEVYDRSAIDDATRYVRFATDDRCYILPARQYKRPDVTIAFLGGSTTECMLVREELRFPARVSSLFAERDIKVNSLNAACSGNTLHDSINVLINHVLLDKPDFVVLMHATNDIGVLKAAGSYELRSSQPLQFADCLGCVKRWLTNHCYVAAHARRALSRHGTFVGDPRSLPWRNDPRAADEVPANEFYRRLNIFVCICREFNVEPILLTQPLCGNKNELTPDWANLGAQDRFNSIIRKVGKEHRALVIDLVRIMNERYPGWNETFDYHYDGMHVNDNGSRIYADSIFEALLPLVERHVRNRE
jgi:lysophospholipase L1-like esterase